MPFNLSSMARRAGKRRSAVMRDIRPPATFATNLYRGIYSPVIALWSEAVTRLEVEYSRTLDGITTDAPANINSELDRVENQSRALFFALTPRLNDWALRVEAWHRRKWRGAVLAASNVDIGALIGPADVRTTLEATIARNVGLVKNVSAQARERMSTVIFEGLRNRTPARDVARQLREVTELAKRRSINIASDQLSKVTSALADERRREAGISDWVWVHSGKLHYRSEHKARDGKEYSDDNAPADRPGDLPFCGCRARALLKI